MMTDRHTEIARRAYHIWENAGRPHGDDLGHWLEAEEELARESASPAALSAAANLVPKAPARKPATSRRKAPARRKA